MAYQPESAVFDVGVFQWETTTPALGGVGGAANSPLLNLANRATYLKQHVDALEAAASGNAPLLSPAFTGSPTAPTQAAGDASTKIATDAFVQTAAHSVTTKDVSGNTNVNLTAAEAGTGILNLTGALTGDISVIVPNTAHRWVVINATTGAHTITLKTAAGASVVLSLPAAYHLYCDGAGVYAPTGGSVSTAADNVFGGITTFGKATRYKYIALAASTNIDCSLGDWYNRTITGTTTLTVTGVAAAGYVTAFALELVNGGAYALTLWSGVKWAGGVFPSLTGAGRDVLVFYTVDGGATWVGAVFAKAVA